MPESSDPDWGAERAAFVGPNADYYVNKWDELEARGTSISWNWAAFLLSLFWLIYRKMFIAAGVAAAGYLLITLLGVLVPNLAPLAGALTIGPAVLVGVFGNRLYRDHVDRSINEVERSVPDRASRQPALQARGGVSMPLALGAAAAWVAIFVGLYFLAFRGTQPSYPELGTGRGEYTGEGSAPRPVTGAWIVGRWEEAGGPTCAESWIRFNADHTFTDSENTVGTWSLTSGFGSETITMTLRGMAPRSGTVVHSGTDTMTIGSGTDAIAWRRVRC